LLTFTAAVFFLFITPGPGVLSLAGVGSGFGFAVGRRYMIGLFLGTNLVALAVVSGLAAAVLAVPHVRDVLLYASAAYLGYLALRIALAGSKIAFMERRNAPGITGGIMLQTINPKAYAVNTTFFSGFGFWPESLAIELAIKFAIMNALWVCVHFLWLWAGVTLHRLDLPDRVQFAINVAMAVSMLIVVVLAVIAQQ